MVKNAKKSIEKIGSKSETTKRNLIESKKSKDSKKRFMDIVLYGIVLLAILGTLIGIFSFYVSNNLFI